jgi:hypothetical protein
MTKIRTPDYTDYRFIGKEKNNFVVTDGIFIKHLTAKEFRVFSRQLFNRN